MQWLKWLHAQKYAIDTQQLGDHRALAWSNLGYWQDGASYLQAGQALAEHLVLPLQLKDTDSVLDLACGQGASLALWAEHYQIKKLCALELQAEKIPYLQKHAHFVSAWHTGCFLQLQPNPFQQKFDVVLCIDAAYHVNFLDFLTSVNAVFAPNGRLGLHLLMLHPDFLQCSKRQQKKYQYLLKSANVELAQLLTDTQIEQTLQQQDFSQVSIRDISAEVFSGFADYIAQRTQHLHGLNGLKIKLTAKLCAQLYRDGWIRYVAVTAQKNQSPETTKPH